MEGPLPLLVVSETRRPQPKQQAPPVQYVRLRYAKRGRARFASHRDFSRALERALRRAGVPMAYSSGFNPHPRISYANAVPTGAASEAEYLELGLAERVDPADLASELTAALPDGFVIVAATEVTGGGLADLLEASHWGVTVSGIPIPTLERAVGLFADAESVTVSRMTKHGMRDFDARGAVESIAVVDDGTLELVIRHQVPLVRPDDVLTALTTIEPLATPDQPAVLTRIAQGRLDAGRVVGPDDGDYGILGEVQGSPGVPRR